MPFDFFKRKKEEKVEIPEIGKETVELTPPSQQEISLPSQPPSQQISRPSEIDRIALIESKIENLRVYLEMINSKLDRLETLLRAKGLI